MEYQANQVNQVNQVTPVYQDNQVNQITPVYQDNQANQVAPVYQNNQVNQFNQPLLAKQTLIINGKEINNFNAWCKLFIPIYILPFFVIGELIFGIFFLENIYFQIPGILAIVAIILVLCGIFLMKSVYYKIGYYFYLVYVIISSVRAVYFLFAFIFITVIIEVFISAISKSDKSGTFNYMRLKLFLFFVFTCGLEFILFFSLIKRLKIFDDLDKHRQNEQLQVGNLVSV